VVVRVPWGMVRSSHMCNAQVHLQTRNQPTWKLDFSFKVAKGELDAALFVDKSQNPNPG
jgi:hypothetical protein